MSHRRVSARTIAAASAVVALTLLALLVPALAAAASATPVAPTAPTARGPLGVTAANGDVVKFQQDYTLPAGKTVPTVVVIRGNATIGGTVRTSVVVVGGDAVIQSTAVVGTQMKPSDSSVVVIGGKLTTQPGATIHGKTFELTGLHIRGILDAAATGALIKRPIGVFWGWWQFLFLPIVALVVAALFPRNVARVADRVRVRFWPSFGWGLLWLVVALIVIVLLAITIIGLIVAIPAAFVLPALLLFCFTGVAALVGRLVLSSSERYRDNVLAAAIVGAVIASLVSLVPAIGGLIVFLASIAGFGAGVSLFNEWRQDRRLAPATPGPTAPGTTPPPSGPQPSVGPAPAAPGPQPPADWNQPAAWTPPPGWTPPPEWTQAGWTPPPGWVPPQAPPQGASEGQAAGQTGGPESPQASEDEPEATPPSG